MGETMSSARLKYYGWGREGEAMTSQERELRARPLSREVRARELRHPRDAASRSARPARASRHAACIRSRAFARASLTIAPPTPMANPIPITCAPCSAATIARPMSWPIRVPRRRFRRSWIGPASIGASLAPFGGGSSVCGGVEHRRDGRHKAAVTVDLKHLGRVLEVDATSRAARIEAGAFGPALESAVEAARPHLAPFPAELRLFDARRLDRDALGRAFRDAL